MPSSTAEKLKVKPAMKLLTLNAPADFKKDLGAAADVKISASAKNPDQIHWFVKDKAQMEEELPEVLAHLKESVICWIYYPKGSSKMQTDLTRDKGWDKLLKLDNLTWVNLISFNNTWSTFGMRLKTNADKKKEEKPKDRPIFDYIDPVKKTIALPEDFGKALKKAKKQETFFNSLSFTNRKEYVEWIVTAKREETRATRVKGSIERLAKEWKNPRNM